MVLAFPGGSTARIVLSVLAAERLPWDRIRVTLTDEQKAKVDAMQAKCKDGCPAGCCKACAAAMKEILTPEQQKQWQENMAAAKKARCSRAPVMPSSIVTWPATKRTPSIRCRTRPENSAEEQPIGQCSWPSENKLAIAWWAAARSPSMRPDKASLR